MTLSTYIPSFLGNIYSYLSWDAAKVQFVIDETLEILGISDESSVSAKKLHSVAKTIALTHALSDLSINYHISADGSSYDNQQVFDHISNMLVDAQNESDQYINKSSVGEVIYSENPYSVKSYYQSI